MREFTINYIMMRMDRTLSETKEVIVKAINEKEAYYNAVCNIIPKTENYPPFKVWVKDEPKRR